MAPRRRFFKQRSDITTNEGVENAKNGSGPLSDYLQKMNEYQRNAMEQLYTNTVDHPCSACQHDEIDLFMSCRQPLSFLHFRPIYEGDDDQENPDSYFVPGMYTIPTTCEYCGAEHLSQCTPECQRPKLFFKKKRPPFYDSKKEWDAVTEYEVDPTLRTASEEEGDPEAALRHYPIRSASPSKEPGTSTWMSGFFRRRTESPTSTSETPPSSTSGCFHRY